jgi:predicted  nucleic acid-binding Zn-ribbon protein
VGWRRSLSALLAISALALAAGCGEDQQEAFAEDFRPLNRQLVSLGEEVGQSIEGAQRKTDAQLEREFGELADQLGRLRRELEGLDPPDDLSDAQEELTAAMRAAEQALRGIEQAAAESDPDAARQSTIELVRASEDLREARRRVAGETP